MKPEPMEELKQLNRQITDANSSGGGPELCRLLQQRRALIVRLGDSVSYEDTMDGFPGYDYLTLNPKTGALHGVRNGAMSIEPTKLSMPVERNEE